MTTNAERAREIVDDLVSANGYVGSNDWLRTRIAAALDAAEARGRNQALQSEQHRTSYNVAFEEGRAEGERAMLERVLALPTEYVVSEETEDGMDGHDTIAIDKIRTLQRGAGEHTEDCVARARVRPDRPFCTCPGAGDKEAGGEG